MQSSKFYQGLAPEGFTKLHYWQWPSIMPNTIMCVHGLTRNGQDFDYLASSLRDLGQVICPDVVGRGKSQRLKNPKSYAIPQYCADINALLNHLRVHELDWVGTSMGGIIGMVLASVPNSPVQRLVLNDVGAEVSAKGLRRIATYAKTDPAFKDWQEASAYIRATFASYGQLPQDRWQHLIESSVVKKDGVLRLDRDPLIAQNFGWMPWKKVKLWNLWEKIRCPVLILRGENSDVLSSEVAKKMQSMHPNCTVVEFKDVGHAPSLMVEDQISIVRNWLIKTPPGGRS